MVSELYDFIRPYYAYIKMALYEFLTYQISGEWVTS